LVTMKKKVGKVKGREKVKSRERRYGTTTDRGEEGRKAQRSKNNRETQALRRDLGEKQGNPTIEEGQTEWANINWGVTQNGGGHPKGKSWKVGGVGLYRLRKKWGK